MPYTSATTPPSPSETRRPLCQRTSVEAKTRPRTCSGVSACSRELNVTAPVEVPTPYTARAPAASGTDAVESRARSTRPRNPNGPKTNSARVGSRTSRRRTRDPARPRRRWRPRAARSPDLSRSGAPGPGPPAGHRSRPPTGRRGTASPQGCVGAGAARAPPPLRGPRPATGASAPSPGAPVPAAPAAAVRSRHRTPR